MEELPRIRPIDADLVYLDVLTVADLLNILYVAEAMAARVLADKVAQVTTKAHIALRS